MIRTYLLRLLTLALPALALNGCGLLDVSDPTVVKEEDVADADGAEMLRRHAIPELYDAFAYGTRYSGLFTDELLALPSATAISSGTVVEEVVVDQRDLEQMEERWISNGGQVFRSYETARLAATQAIQWFQKYGSPAQRPHLGQLLAVRGFIITNMAEQLCSGFALHGLKDGHPDYKPPITTAEAFAAAMVDLDSAVVAAKDSARFLDFARIARGRALLGLGRFAEAAEAVKEVPTNFTYYSEHTNVSPGKANRLNITFNRNSNNIGIADNEGGNGLDFISSGDPRVRPDSLGVGHDNVTVIYGTHHYKGLTTKMLMASGIEARLIEAEAQLAGEAPGDWLATLNDLRANIEVLDLYGIDDPAELGPLVDPGTDDARVDLLFRERAFWLFLTGHRLGDLRRLVTHYGRSPESVFPSGTHFLGVPYGSVYSIPFMPANEQYAGTGVTGCKG